MMTIVNKRWVLRFFSICILAVLVALAGCREKRPTVGGIFDPSKFDEDDFAALLSRHYAGKPINDSAWAKKKLHTDIKEYRQHVYQANEYYPLWLDEDGNTTYVEELVKDIEELQKEGLRPERYGLVKIRQNLDYFKTKREPVLDSIVALDTLCTQSYLQAAHDLLFGAVSVKEADDLWYHANDTVWNVDTLLLGRLYREGKYPSLEVFRSKLPVYTSLMKERERYAVLSRNAQLMAAKNSIAADTASADSIRQFIIKTELPALAAPANDSPGVQQNILAQYQQYYGLKPTGKLDTSTKRILARKPAGVIDLIDVNLERLRWLPQSFEKDYVLVNVPLMELFFKKDGQEVMHMNVVVGKPERQTPVLNANMTNIVFNPSWGVPPTILKKDVLPGVQKSGEAYLAKKDLVVYDRKGRRVDPSIINASNYKKYVFRQPPGDDNALGYIKFNLPNKWDIYLHDTPHRELFSRPNRAQSSGCVRVQQPREMAEFILTQMEGKDYGQQKIEEVIQTQSTKQINLQKKIPVHILYLTVFSNDNEHVRFLKDIYGRDAKVLALLKEA